MVKRDHSFKLCQFIRETRYNLASKNIQQISLQPVTITAGLEAKKIHHNIRLAVHKMTMTLETICRIARKQILVGSTTNDDSFWYTQVSVSVSIQLWHIYRAPKRTCFRELWKSMFLVVSIWCNKGGGGGYYDNDCVGDDHAAHLL